LKADVLKRFFGSTVLVGSLMVIASRKEFEKHPNHWKMKARVVVKDKDGLAATFQELQASAPSSIAGLNIVMAYILAPLLITVGRASSVC
jgi:hypothetical protein